jgi:hypothetical protein
MHYSLPGKAAPPVVRQALSWVRQASTEDEAVQKDADRMKRILGTDRELICERQSIRRKQKTENRVLASVV